MKKIVEIAIGAILLVFAAMGVWYCVTLFSAEKEVQAACTPVPVLKPEVLQCPVPEPLIVFEPLTCPVFPVLDQLYVSPDPRKVLRNPPKDDKGGFISWLGNKVRLGYRW